MSKVKTKKSKTTRIFVYGTLKKGFTNHRYLSKAKFIANAHTGKGFALYVGRLALGMRSLPYLVEEEGATGVYGEIYEITEKAVQEMDYFEGHPKFYCRTPITALSENGEPIEVSIYVFQTGKDSRFGDLFLACKDKLTIIENYIKDEY